MARLALAFAVCLLAAVCFLPSSSAAPPLVGAGGDCDAIVHVECSHVTAMGTCHVFVGGSGGACVVYGPPIVGYGGECTEMVHTGGCGHVTANGPCWLYVGGANGACILWLN